MKLLRLPGVDVGTREFGIAMTEAEMSKVDLPGRMNFANAVKKELLPHAERLATYAGAWLDPFDGQLVVSLTTADPEEQSRLRSLLPPSSRGLRFEAAKWTFHELELAAARGFDVWQELARDIRLLSVDVDEVGNRVRFFVAPTDVATGQGVAGALSDSLGVDTVVAPTTEPVEDTACTRTNCVNPHRAGIHIVSAGGGAPCTMAFHITIGGNEHFLTAGHCGYYSATWWHNGAQVGTVLDSLWGPDGKDIMYVSMADAQRSEQIYGHGGAADQMAGDRAPLLNEDVCVSRATSDDVPCGWVASTSLWWNSSTGNQPRVHGANMDGIPNAIPGDSGSPIFSRTYITGGSPYWLYTAIGVWDTAGGYFARVADALDIWGAEIYR